MKNPVRPLLHAILGAGLLAASLSTTALPAQAAPPPSTTYQTHTAPNGVKSQYHLYGNKVDTNQPVGVLFVFHGDYTYPSQSYIHYPNGPTMTAMAAEAAKKNMIMVPVITPDKKGGITWWEDADRNGDWFRSLASTLISKYGLDTSRIWFHGYSGGAEFITFEVLADRQGWIKGGGATIVGGGGWMGMESAPTAAVKKMKLHWISGSRDGKGGTTLSTWSALDTAKNAEKKYRALGFSSTRMTTLPGITHYNYNMPSLLAGDLRAVPDRMPAANTSAHIRSGDIAAIDPDGFLYTYPSAKGGDLARRTYVSAGWKTALNVEVADWNKDGVQDIVANWKNGKLTVDYGQARGGFKRATIGSGGWQNLEVLVAEWKKADRYPGLIAKDKRTGKLYAYTNPKGAGHGPRTQIGASGWKNLKLAAMNYDKDEKIDLIVKTAAGQLKLYRSNGNGKFISEPRKVIGKSGWNAMTHLSAIPDHTGTGKNGILARDKAGNLHYYPVGVNKISKRITIGAGGWDTLRLGS